MTDTLETLEGNITAIIYFDEETNYTVMKLEPTTYVMGVQSGVVTVVGNMPEMQLGEFVRVTGDWIVHQRFGKQIKAKTIERIMPATEEGIRKYLGSGLIKGIGGKTADRIVDAFGLETLDVLDSPDAERRLKEIEGIGDYRAEMIAKTWQEQRAIAEVMMFLAEYGVGTALSLKIYGFYKEQNTSPIYILQTNPYQLIRDIKGIGFRIADRIALNLGLPSDSIDRMMASIIHVLDGSRAEGNVFLPAPELVHRAAEFVNLEEDRTPIQEALETMVSQNDVRVETIDLPHFGEIRAIYNTYLYNDERIAARRVRELVSHRGKRLEPLEKLSEAEWANLLSRISQYQGVSLSGQQQSAVRMALTSKISILTGGPGTGKTTTLRSVIAGLLTYNVRFSLASPTGRAAKRLSDAVGQYASTIHRMLGFQMPGQFTYNEDNPLPTDFVIIDEASMLDIELFASLMSAMPIDAHLLLVGDVNQLPSVGPGDVLRDLIASRICPVTRLQAIFRQDSTSMIVSNAHLINQGELPVLDNQASDFFFFGEENPDEASALLVDVVQNRIPNRFGYHPVGDVQVLSPMYRTAVGVTELNAALQEKLNPPDPAKAEKVLSGRLLRVGDKVMQKRNDYEKKVFNGDIGYITVIDDEALSVHVDFEGTVIEYEWLDTDDLTLAYACTVHRSQGSEYPVVVMPLLTQHYMMLQRNLLYTAITRAKEMVVIVGTRKAVGLAVRNNKIAKRWSALDWRLRN